MALDVHALRGQREQTSDLTVMPPGDACIAVAVQQHGCRQPLDEFLRTLVLIRRVMQHRVQGMRVGTLALVTVALVQMQRQGTHRLRDHGHSRIARGKGLRSIYCHGTCSLGKEVRPVRVKASLLDAQQGLDAVHHLHVSSHMRAGVRACFMRRATDVCG